MWVVARLQKFSDFELSAKVIPPITIDPGKMVGYLAVYATQEDAEADWPDGPFYKIAFWPHGPFAEITYRSQQAQHRSLSAGTGVDPP